MSQVIRIALGKLDPTNDDHWTSDGTPRLDVVKDLGGVAVSRAEVTGAAKGFTRANPVLDDAAPVTDGDGGADAGAPAVPGAGSGGATADVDGGAEGDAEPEGDADEAIEAELADAEGGVADAQARLRKALEDMDVVITRRAQESAGRTTAQDIKAYQASQAAQRQLNVDRQRRMAEAALVDKSVA